MDKTIKLYDLDSYKTEFDAKVVSLEVSENKIDLILDQTVFFPEEGGQTPDRGTITTADGFIFDVADVQLDKDGIIHHFVLPFNQTNEVTSSDAIIKELKTGETIHGQIDWAHRFDNMQQHTGEHIISGLVHSQFGYENVGFHLSDNTVTLDFDGPLSAEDIRNIERKTNEVIVKNIPIKTYFPTPDEASALIYRSKLEINEGLRIVEIVGVDVCACCAPHVHKTGEIGMMKVVAFNPHRGGMRLTIVCGFRALDLFRAKMSTIDTLIGTLTTSEENLNDQVKKQQSTIQTLGYKLGLAKQELLINEIGRLSDDEKHIVLFCEDVDMNSIRKVINETLEARPALDFCAIFVGHNTEGNGSYTFILGSKNKDCNEYAKLLRSNLKAKCGGSFGMIQGSVEATQSDILAIF